MAFGLFILVNAILFIRPGEILPATEGWPIYQVCILACLACAYREVGEQFNAESLARRPITVCVLGLWGCVVLSHLVRFRTFEARHCGIEFGKVVLYYLLLVGIIHTRERLRQFLVWLLMLATMTAGLAVLQNHEYINLPSLNSVEEHYTDPRTGEEMIIRRLCSTGIFNDPNDLCLVLSLGIMIGMYFLNDRQAGVVRLLWLGPLALFVYTLYLTKSRGGLLGVVAGLAVLVYARYGWKRSAVVLALAVAGITAMGGRQGNINLKDSTGQARIQLWSEGFGCLRGSPLFGIGADTYAEEVGQVAHNAFVHCYVELGFLGGALFAGMFYLGMARVWKYTARVPGAVDPELCRLGAYLLAVVVGYAAGIFSLSRTYVIPTYLVLGLTVVHARVMAEQTGRWEEESALVRRVFVVGILTLAGLYLWVRLFARFG